MDLLNLTQTQIDLLEGAAWENGRVQQFQAAIARRERHEKLRDEHALQEVHLLFAEFWAKEYRIASIFIAPHAVIPMLRGYRQSNEINVVKLYSTIPNGNPHRNRPIAIMELEWE